MDFLRAGTRVLLAAVVPAVGEEDQPLLQAVIRQVEAAGGVLVAQVLQRRGVSRSRGPGGARRMRMKTPLNPATWLGTGKVEELATRVAEVRAEVVLVAHPLSEAQRRNLEERLGVPVLAHGSPPARTRGR